MLIDKNILAACGISFALHGMIFGMSGFGSGPVEQKNIPEEIEVCIALEKPAALLPKIRNLGETKKVKKIEQKTQKPLILEKKPELSVKGLSQKVQDIPLKNPKPENPASPLIPDNTPKQKTEKITEEKMDSPDPDKEAMLDFHTMVKQRIEEARRYPLWARKKGIQGITRISFTVMPDGTCRDMKITGSSGSKILDHEALETLKRAEPFPSVPEKISISPISLEVGIVFSLQKKD